MSIPTSNEIETADADSQPVKDDSAIKLATKKTELSEELI